MAATAHSDPYSIFMRKIGYSVGLEYTAERVGDLTLRYLQDRDVTTANWHELVTGSKAEGNWGRNTSAEKHIADFFFSLRLIQRTPGDLLVLENLDAMAIASELLDSEEKRRAARDFLLLWAILVNDGEIFINMLLAGFEEQAIKDTLGGMILEKRAILAERLGAKASNNRINRVITIERQEKNKGSAGAGQTITSIRRTEPLQAKRAGGRKNEEDRIEFSEDYLDKVPKSRRSWAISLGLWDEEKGVTQCGQDFLDALRRDGYIDGTDRFTYWPMDYELVRAGFRPDLFGEQTKGLWSCLTEFGGAYGDLRVKAHAKSDVDTSVLLIGDMMDSYRNLHVRKALLRRELPITVAFPALVSVAYARGESLIDLPAAIAAEQTGDQRRLALRRSRNIGGALSVKR